MAAIRVLDRVGQVLGGRFRLLAPIGTGASASVYVAEDVVLRRRVAVKVLHAALADDEAFLRRFRAEAHAAAALNHPHIVAIYDWGQDADADAGAARAGGHGGIPFLVTEYLGGGSLRSMLDASGPLTPAQALLVGLEAARGLEYAHRRGFVHRDIKPANLLFDEEARLRIADFGLARALAEAAWTEPMAAVLGTARYASPEQARGESLDGKSDVYSLALVIIEAVTGQVPFAADTTIGTLMARVNQSLRVPDALVALRAPLEWAGVPDPAQRPDAAEFGAALMAAAVDFDRPSPLVLAGMRGVGEPFSASVQPAGSFLVAGPGWDPANDRDSPESPGVPESPESPVSPESPEMAGYAPTDEQLQAAPRRKRRGLSRVLPLTAGPDPSVADLTPALAGAGLAAGDTGSTLITPAVGPVAIADPTATTWVEGRPPVAGTPSAVTAAPRWGAASADGRPADPVAGYTPSPYDSVTTEFSPIGVAGPGYGPAAHGPTGSGPDGYGPDGYGPDGSGPDGYARDGYGTASRRDRRSAQRIAEAEIKADRLVAKAERRTHRRRRWPAVVMVMVLASGGAGASAYWWFLVRVPTHPVPALVGKNVAELEGLIGEYGWTVAQDYRYDDAAPAGQILTQKPGPTVELLRGGTVAVVISKGLPPVDVPTTVVGQKRDAAAATLTKAGLGVGPIDTRFDEKVPKDVVISLAAGTPAQVRKGTDVGLVVSSGPEPRTIPDGLVGKPVDDALSALEDLGLKASTTEAFSDAISAGNVISVAPGVGRQAERGSTVAIVVSKGPPTVSVPTVEGASVAEATTALEDAGLVVSGLEGSPRKKVTATDPPAGTTVRKGSKVKLFTEKDPTP